VTCNGVFPGFKHFLVVLFFSSYAFLIVKFGELGGAFIVHFGLDVTADLSVAFTNLTKNVSLVSLLVHGNRHCLLSVGLILSINLSLILRSFIIFEPLRIVFLKFLKLDIGFTVLVDILKKVNASLVFTSPLGLLL